jgi:BirA family transcriptional regulator, biotin operon repressor / biotin---[acetyl-CoA-carboxylase] ligase
MIEGWALREYQSVDSTNPIAAKLPAWSAVTAKTQTHGRGRTGRHWVSDEGGLWLSASVPTPGPNFDWSMLPLAVGWAILSVVRNLGITDARLRWPNDIMVGRQKLAGLIVDRFRPETAVIGIGINISNSPAACDASLSGQTTRLADLLPCPPSREELISLILPALKREHSRLQQGHTAALCADLNASWGHRSLQVMVNGTDKPMTGLFDGIDPHGALLLSTPDGKSHRLPAHHVELLREIF